MSHAELSPSSSHRWKRCTASIPYVRKLRAEGKIPKDESSKYADEGTIAHTWASKALIAHRDKQPFDYEQIPDRLMANHVKAFVNLVVEKITGDGQLFIEHRMPLFYAYRGPAEMEVEIVERKASAVAEDKTIIPGEYWITPKDPTDISEWGPFGTWDEASEHFFEHVEPLGYWKMEYGTGDAIVLTEECLFVFDLKYGVGVSVEGKENDQTGIYAESFIVEQNLRDRLPAQFDCRPTIFQPRDADMSQGPIREWITTIGEIGQIAKETAQIAELIRAERIASFVPGKKQCRFCPAKPKCEHKAKFDLQPAAEGTALATHTDPTEVVIGEVVAGPFIEPRELSDEYLEKIAALHLEGHFTDWLSSVVKYVTAKRLEGAKPSDLLKLVKGSKHRTWTNEAEAIRLLCLKLKRELVVKEKVVSPSAAWDLLPSGLSTKLKNKINALIIKPEGDLTLVLASDKRDAVEVAPKTAQGEFGDAMEEDYT